MKNIKAVPAFWLLLCSLPTMAEVSDDPTLTKVMLNQLEIRDIGDDNTTAWDAQAWIGKDLQKIWIKSEGEYANSKTEESEVQLLYSHAIAPYWDAQIGWRGDIRPSPDRHWLALGFQGVAPYFFEIDSAIFIANHGRVGARIEAEYEFLFTQQLILTPELEMNFYSKDDIDTHTGAGLSDIETGLRLRYEIRREIAPYVGINWSKKVGKSADFSREANESTEKVEALLGIRVWF
ncbi:copper resistance protein B [Alkalimarinus sediminis]|uniref:Copper resistance protein B n=1 Tax=Alkalimarinus sediminis TaxID=1632866 RepID=A0A9E8HL17_9ALTE|nr:copper resistance protein B [Alkalimarinus sediminis]UZW76285.1 copper resistance protein B [Alkalimarinus sediminis]